MKIILSLMLMTFSINISFAQQLADTTYSFKIISPVYRNKGAIIGIDEGHQNIHTANGRYSPLKKLLENDGYRVISVANTLNRESLSKCKIFITANSLNAINVNRWILPTPSAFGETEISLLKDWVNNGGRLFIITDHMPCAGAVESLLKTFGFEISNGFATGDRPGDYLRFKTNNGSLASNKITNGRNRTERVDSVSTFTGSAFKIPSDAESLLTFKGNFISMTPDTAWQFREDTPRISINGWSQGAVLEYGKGKVAVFAEAAMFTAQTTRGIKVGFNSPHAPQNAQFALNVIHWLDGIIE